MNSADIKALLDRYLDGSATSAERRQVEQWLESSKRTHNEWEAMTAGEKAAWLAKFYGETLDIIRNRPERSQTIQASQTSQKSPVPQSSQAPIRRLPWRRRLRVAAVFLLIGSGIYYITRIKPQAIIAKASGERPATNPVARPVAPGSNKAVLTLSDGSIIQLDSSHNGVLAQQGNASVSKKGEQLIYHTTPQPATAAVAYNTLATPRGGQYTLVLPDGSRVWLNAASSIRYPTSFDPHERRVEITGEAYFEIAQAPNHPFKVLINTATGNCRGGVEVLGTHFNINAYSDEPAIHTTLLQGSIRVASLNESQKDQEISGTGKILTPGQDARIDLQGAIDVQTANTEAAIAWKDGLFLLHKADVANVLRQLARWYDVDIVYRATIPRGHITGDFPRTMALSDALKILSMSGVRLSLEGRKIIVDP